VQDFAVVPPGEGKRAFEYLDIDRRLMLKLVLKRWMDVGWIIWLRLGTNGRLLQTS
jgi:hypothetical protein